MKIYTIVAHVFVAVPDGADVPQIAADFDHGLTGALEHFPAATVVSTDVESIAPTSEEVIDQRSLDAELDEIERDGG